jgi:hypothetical protein
MPWRRITSGLVLPFGLFALNLFVFAWDSLEPEPTRWEEHPLSVEGVMLGLLALLLGGWLAWTAISPSTERVFPEWGATFAGPPVFPVTVHIGHDTLGFTNGSSQPWSCTATLGFPNVTAAYTLSFPLGPKGNRELAYLAFQCIRPDMEVVASVVRLAGRARSSASNRRASFTSGGGNTGRLA